VKNTDNIVFFDGVCNVCNFSVNRLINCDKKRILRYSSLQGECAATYLDKKSIEGLDSVVFYTQGKTYHKSEAAIQILIKLGGLYKFIGQFFSLIPNSVRNFIYDFVAKNRYRFFGKKEQCRVPTVEEKSLFLD